MLNRNRSYSASRRRFWPCSAIAGRQGVAAQAFWNWDNGEIARSLAMEAAHRQTQGRRAAVIGVGTAATDPCAAGEAMLEAWRATGDPVLEQACGRLAHWALVAAPRNDKGIVYHFTDKKEFWVDSFYMLPPFLAAYGAYDEAMRQICGYWDALYLPEKRLLAHRWDDGAQRFVKKACWGVGVGWALAGMTRVWAHLPPERIQQRQWLAQRMMTLLESALDWEQAGLFHDVLDDPDTFLEVNFSQQCAYCIFRGVARGYFPEKMLQTAQRLYDAALKKVDRFGLVQDVCGAPRFDAPGTAAEGQAFFLLMEAARRDCENKRSASR